LNYIPIRYNLVRFESFVNEFQNNTIVYTLTHNYFAFTQIIWAFLIIVSWNISYRFGLKYFILLEPIRAYGWFITGIISGRIWKFYNNILAISTRWCYMKRRFFMLGEILMFPTFIAWALWPGIVGYIIYRDYSVIFLISPVLLWLTIVARSVISINWKKEQTLVFKPVLEILSIHPLFDPKNGMYFNIDAKKPIELTISQARLYFTSEEFWNTLVDTVGRAIISVFKLSFYPINLIPKYMENSFKIGEEYIKLQIKFGTHDQGWLKINNKWVLIPRLNMIKDEGDPEVRILLEYGNQSWSGWNVEGVLLDIGFKISDMINCANNQSDLISHTNIYGKVE